MWGFRQPSLEGVTRMYYMQNGSIDHHPRFLLRCEDDSKVVVKIARAELSCSNFRLDRMKQNSVTVTIARAALNLARANLEQFSVVVIPAQVAPNPAWAARA